MSDPEAGVSERFGAVADAFRQNFDDPGEDAAAVTVFHQGTKVVDLWAGIDVINQRPMSRSPVLDCRPARWVPGPRVGSTIGGRGECRPRSWKTSGRL